MSLYSFSSCCWCCCCWCCLWFCCHCIIMIIRAEHRITICFVLIVTSYPCASIPRMCVNWMAFKRKTNEGKKNVTSWVKKIAEHKALIEFGRCCHFYCFTFPSVCAFLMASSPPVQMQWDIYELSAGGVATKVHTHTRSKTRTLWILMSVWAWTTIC